MIRKAAPADTEAIMGILLSVGNQKKNPAQGFLMTDYTKDELNYRQKYEADLQKLRYCYVYSDNDEIKAFLIAYTGNEWQSEVPGWEKNIYWNPGFDRERLRKFVLINQTAMYPELTGQGIGSRLYEALFRDLSKADIKDIFAETIIAPVPNFASLNFRLKQQYQLAGVRYEEHKGVIFTTLVYHKSL